MSRRIGTPLVAAGLATAMTASGGAQAQEPPRPSLGSVPYTTPGLLSGDTQPRLWHQPQITQPFFLVGFDERSLAWLEHYRDTLVTLGAIGFLVAARDEDDIERVRASADGLRVHPLPMQPFVEQLGLTHYPVLVSSEGVEQ